MVEPFVSNVLSNKYDTALDFHVTMYDELPYKRDSDYCNREKIAMHSNSLINIYYFEPEFSLIDNGDEDIERYLSELLLKQSNQKANLSKANHGIEQNDDGVTDEQIQTLLDENGNPMSEENNLENTTNPFADVEDW